MPNYDTLTDSDAGSEDLDTMPPVTALPSLFASHVSGMGEETCLIDALENIGRDYLTRFRNILAFTSEDSQSQFTALSLTLSNFTTDSSLIPQTELEENIICFLLREFETVDTINPGQEIIDGLRAELYQLAGAEHRALFDDFSLADEDGYYTDSSNDF